MAVKWSVPGIRFKEIDNTIQNNADPGIGIGAIVLKANKGPVNQRILTRNYQQFTEFFGQPEALDDYGHFAAENYLAVSNQLMCVRATMGDEEYAQIQFAYPEAQPSATNESVDTCVFKYVDNLLNNNLDLIQPLSGVTYVTSLVKEDPETGMAEWIPDEGRIAGYALKQCADWASFRDIITEADETIVYKKGPSNVRGLGYHVTYPQNVDENGLVLSTANDLIFEKEAWESDASAAPEVITVANTPIGEGEEKGYKVTINIPDSYTLTEGPYKLTMIATASAAEEWKQNGVVYNKLFDKENFYPANTFSGFDEQCDPDWYFKHNYGVQNAAHLQLLDWEDVTTPKQYYVDMDNIETGVVSGTAQSLKYQEYEMAGDQYAIIGTLFIDGEEHKEAGLYMCSGFSGMVMNSTDKTNPWLGGRTPKKVAYDMANEYSVSDVSDLNTYYYLAYYDVLNQQLVEKVVKTDVNKKKDIDEYLFRMFAKQNAEKTTTVAVVESTTPEFAVLPIQEDYQYTAKVKLPESGETAEVLTKVNGMNATPSSYIFNSTDKTYVDGYTVATETEDEPGIGDIEQYVSNFDNQLVIASIGPGKYGNDVGVSIITTECSEINALQHQNAFNWKYLYDDEDQVDDDAQDYSENDADLTWKKVFRINVYTKPKTQTAKAAWGSGMDALLKDPVESFMVSTDPYVKDSDGNSLYAPTVINGHSDYIYVSRSSVALAKNSRGKYEQPKQTYSIYQLTGGKNSKKNNMQEKTAALSLYADRQKANFDILFNVEAIETFNAKPAYMSHQRRLGQIAGDRTMDIAVVQTTSKSAKTCKQMLNETKSFSFNNGTYVAMYAGYDKYYNSTLGSWIYLPKSVAGACAMAFCDNFAYPWMAPAGVQRGGITYTAGQLKRLTDDEIGQLYDAMTNTSRQCGGFGEVLWGQKTALKKVSALNRINVRRCLNTIEKNLENSMTPYLFQQNTPNTRASAKNVIDSYLQRVKAGEGIISYSTSVTADPEDAHIMNVNIRLVPAEAIEFIDVKINIDRNNGVTVSE